MRLGDRDAAAVGRVVREWLCSLGDYLADECHALDRDITSVDLRGLAETLDTAARAVRILADIEARQAERPVQGQQQ
jgi:hypothetical protein